MADIYFDFFELPNPGAASSETEKTVILVGAKREMIEVLIGVIRECGMRTAVVECSVFSAANMFEHNYGAFEGLSVLLDIGSATTKLSLIINGVFADTREIPVAGDEYTKRLMEGLAVDRASAETLKVAASQGEANSPPDLVRIIGETNDIMVQDVRNSIEYFLQGGDPLARSAKLNHIYITGGGGRILGLDASLAATLQVPVQILNPFQKIDINPKTFQMDYVLMQGHLYGIAVGLGLRTMSDHS
jgi:type IV pilus assembly protein PilM